MGMAISISKDTMEMDNMEHLQVKDQLEEKRKERVEERKGALKEERRGQKRQEKGTPQQR